MRKHLIYLSFTVLFFCIYCTREKESGGFLLSIEKMIEQDPEYALILLDSIDPSHYISKENLSYYYLLLTEATNSNHQSLLPCDSILNVAFNYFRKENQSALLCRAWICKGKIFQELNEPQKAISAFREAETIAERSKQTEILQYVYSVLGNFYIDQELYEEAIKAFHTSCLIYSASSDLKNMSSCLLEIGWAYLLINEPDSTEHYFKQALRYGSQLIDSTVILNRTYNYLSIYYEQTGNYKEAFNCLNKVTDKGDPINLLKGSLFVETMQYDSAKYYLNISVQSSNIYTQAASHYHLYELEESLENYKCANNHLMNFHTSKDSIEKLTQTAEIRILNHKYNLDKTVKELKWAHQKKSYVFILGFIFIFFLLLVIYIQQDKKKKINKKNLEREILQKEKEISEQKTLISETQTILYQLQQEKKGWIESYPQIKDKEQDLTKFQEQIIQMQCELFKIKPIYKKIRSLESAAKKTERKVFNYNQQEELKKEVNVSFTNFIEKLKNRCEELREDDLILCCLYKLNLSSVIISSCLGYNDTNSLRQRKYRIKNKIEENIYNSIFSNNQ